MMRRPVIVGSVLVMMTLLGGCMNLFNSDRDSGSSGSAAIPQYFWGAWVRMDGTNEEWYISDRRITVDGQPQSVRGESESSLQVSGERMERRTENMASVTPSSGLPYYLFRKSGANSEVIGGVRGDGILSASGFSASNVGGIAGINAVLRNVANQQNTIQVATDSDGTLRFNEVILGDEYVFEVPRQSGVGQAVAVTVVPEFDGESVGFVTLTDAPQNFSVDAVLSDGDQWGYRYAETNYEITIRITNIGSDDMLSAEYEVIPPDGLSLSGEPLAQILGTVRGNGGVKELNYTLRAASFTEDYRDFRIPVRVISYSSNREWRDEISLRFNRGTMSIQVRSDETENGAEVQGVVISPDRRSFPFRTTNRFGSITVPARDTGYVLALSGADYTSETRYALRINGRPITDGRDLRTTGINEPNNDETQATRVGTSFDIVGYLGVSDLDFYEIYNRQISLPATVDWELYAPDNGVTLGTRTPFLSWSAVAGAHEYEVEVGSSIQTAVTTEITWPQDLADGNYSWRVRARDLTGGVSEWSGEQSFTVNWGAITGRTPFDRGYTDTGFPTFVWDSVGGGAQYQVQIGEDSTSMESSSPIEVAVPEFTPASAIPEGESRFWRVRAVSPGGVSGSWSDTWQITHQIFAVGDTGPAGGIVFFDKGSYSDGWRYKSAAPEDQSTGATWSEAFEIAEVHDGGGYSDWMLPSSAELFEMDQYRATIPGFPDPPGRFWWSSTSWSETRAYTAGIPEANYIVPISEVPLYTNLPLKTTRFRVRLIRYF